MPINRQIDRFSLKLFQTVSFYWSTRLRIYYSIQRSRVYEVVASEFIVHWQCSAFMNIAVNEMEKHVSNLHRLHLRNENLFWKSFLQFLQSWTIFLSKLIKFNFYCICVCVCTLCFLCVILRRYLIPYPVVIYHHAREM